jgi:pimeloyl-ACP methyl ester carboxylesterase
MLRGEVTSRDGTTIGYRQLGRGPGLLLLHGGMMASQNFVSLGAALSDTFTVTIPDRRGRGKSGPFGEGYGIAKDCEDVAALLQKTSATDVFGLSSGAVIALEAALTLSAVERVAAFEPPLSVCGFDYAHWADRFDREVGDLDLAAAMVTVMRGTGDSRLLKLVPRFLLERAFRLGMRADERRARDGDVPIRELVPTMHFDALIVREASASFDRFATMRPSVLLLGGAKSASFLGAPLDALERILPRATRVELPRAGHLAADNHGKPEVVAAALRRFFTPA